jgi:phosphohistidine phosphatase
MKIHLLRHAKTERTSVSGKDFDRKLVRKGHKQCELLQKYFQNKNFDNTVFLVSTATRTIQTAEMSITNQKFNFLHTLYLSLPRTILNEMEQVENGFDVFIVGHNEGISQIASFLVNEQLNLKTGHYIEFSVPGIDDYKLLTRGCAIITENYRPEVN